MVRKQLILALVLATSGMASTVAMAGGLNAQFIIGAPTVQSQQIERHRDIRIYGAGGRVRYDEHTEYPGYSTAYGYHAYSERGQPGYHRYPPVVAAPAAPGGYAAPRSYHYGAYPGSDMNHRHRFRHHGHRQGHDWRRRERSSTRTTVIAPFSHSDRRRSITDRALIRSRRERIPSHRQSLAPR